MKDKWVSAYMDTAYRFAELSSATKLKVGAIIVKDDRIISIGYNGTPSGWDNVCEDESGVTKPEVIHAEMNCITKLASSSESAKGSTMFITHAPCIHCAKLIAACGISYVYYGEKYRDDAGLDHLERCGVLCC
ncbi:ComEB Deoxycytidylate deaminase [uncultured Caudovirales phage]|uniref:ComEB Deoxycytidylate deaminase n=1 Tax=uncultured Caudovirales phage TaxID=2100421 RepID=A0A6J5PN81_9CAUD|nr:ComEB Deoxycytidylate deaminase [uncultured Caudovirales phage]CAB4170558.1 ComEB Deoxycytidylate deaminase [uncultured Caudovirales phage]CAB4176969.1 ComEB Deoxycytidylate deaminase [uncultured Caudovirales phage]CAB4223389.1 ComEB Deoxycytidylate deaminase [uncultured Caudovirales phage]